MCFATYQKYVTQLLPLEKQQSFQLLTSLFVFLDHCFSLEHADDHGLSQRLFPCKVRRVPLIVVFFHRDSILHFIVTSSKINRSIVRTTSFVEEEEG